MSKRSIAAEFARKARVFHAEVENPMNIQCWGLFSWYQISKLVKSGDILLNKGYSKENKMVWCKPSQAFYDKWVKPFMSYEINDLEAIAGW